MILSLLEASGSDIKRSYTLDDHCRLQELINQDPSRPMKTLTREFNISEFIVRKKMTQDIFCKLSALRRGQFMSRANKGEETGKGKGQGEQAEESCSKQSAYLFLRQEELLTGPKSESKE
jgi:hypothetical protein